MVLNRWPSSLDESCGHWVHGSSEAWTWRLQAVHNEEYCIVHAVAGLPHRTQRASVVKTGNSILSLDPFSAYTEYTYTEIWIQLQILVQKGERARGQAALWSSTELALYLYKTHKWTRLVGRLHSADPWLMGVTVRATDSSMDIWMMEN
jgi:hypothetical protein